MSGAFRTPDVEWPEESDARAEEAKANMKRLRSILVRHEVTQPIAELLDEVWASGYEQGWHAAWREALTT